MARHAGVAGGVDDPSRVARPGEVRVALGLSPQTSAKRGSQSHWGERWQAECGPDPEGVGESEDEARVPRPRP